MPEDIDNRTDINSKESVDSIGAFMEPRINPDIPPPSSLDKWIHKIPFRNRAQKPLTQERESIQDFLVPPSSRPLPDINLFPQQNLAEQLAQLQNLISEMTGRRDGYRFYPNPAEREELVQISERTADYLHDNGIRNFILLDRSARPAYIGVKEVWKKKYPDEPLPDIYFLNPTGFVNAETADEPGKSGFPKGMEIMLEAQDKGNDIGNPFLDIRSQEDIEREFTESYKRLTANKDLPTLLYDNCIHSGDSVRPVQATLQNIGFTNLKLGVVGEDLNSSGITPDFVAVQGTPLGVCYPFDRDRMVERRFDSVTSRATNDPVGREKGRALRQEIRNIVNGISPEIEEDDALLESPESGIKKGDVQTVEANDRLPLLERVATQVGTTIETLATAGEEYTIPSKPGRNPYTGIVSEGMTYIKINRPPSNNYSEFWKAVKAEEARAKELAGSSQS